MLGSKAASSPRLPRLPLAVVLAFVAGWVDAVGYLHFARVFVSFMSGNSTVLGIAIGQAAWTKVVSPLVAIAFFVLGSFIGSLIRGLARDWRAPVVLSVEALALLLALAVLPRTGGELAPAIAPLALAMGAQNAVMREVGGVRITLTYVTGALLNLGQSLADAVLRRGNRSAWRIHASIWLALIGGGTGGAFAYSIFGFTALAGPIIVLDTLAIVELALALVWRHRQTGRTTSA